MPLPLVAFPVVSEFALSRKGPAVARMLALEDCARELGVRCGSDRAYSRSLGLYLFWCYVRSYRREKVLLQPGYCTSVNGCNGPQVDCGDTRVLPNFFNV